MNIGLTIEAIDNLIIGLQQLKLYTSTYDPKELDYNAAMKTGTVQLVNSDYKITLYKLPPLKAQAKAQETTTNTEIDLIEDEGE